MTDALHYSPAGARRDGAFALPGEVFDGTVNEAALYRAVVAHRNNQRQGTHKTKSRSEISGGNQKPWRQKGTGRARQGTTRAPHWRGGGIVFGPTPRDYTTAIPRKLRQLARKSALNARAREQNLLVVERLSFDGPKTRQLLDLLGRMEAEGKVLVLTNGHNPNVYLSGRNVPHVQVMAYTDASAYDILWSDRVIVEEAALTGVEPEATDEPAAPAPARKKAPKAKAAKRAAKPAAEKKKAPRKKAATRSAAKAAKKGSTKAAAKPATKKKAAKSATRKKGGK